MLLICKPLGAKREGGSYKCDLMFDAIVYVVGIFVSAELPVLCRNCILKIIFVRGEKLCGSTERAGYLIRCKYSLTALRRQLNIT
jgi:hypothetical protein